MSYKCEICGIPSHPGQGRLLHLVLRPNGQIARELPVCRGCQRHLADGVAIAALRADADRVKAKYAVLPKIFRPIPAILAGVPTQLTQSQTPSTPVMFGDEL